MKDQITYLPDNADRSVAKQKFKITNWPTYNKALINRGSITGTVAKLAMRQPFVLFKGLTFQKLCL
ncbi:hypothetical protein ACP0HD_23870, partial [Escherichia coli]